MKKHDYSVFKNTKKSDKMNLTRFNTVESNIVPEKCWKWSGKVRQGQASVGKEEAK